MRNEDLGFSFCPYKILSQLPRDRLTPLNSRGHKEREGHSMGGCRASELIGRWFPNRGGNARRGCWTTSADVLGCPEGKGRVLLASTRGLAPHGGGWPVHCRTLSSIPGLHPLDARSTLTPSCDNQQYLHTLPIGP